MTIDSRDTRSPVEPDKRPLGPEIREKARNRKVSSSSSDPLRSLAYMILTNTWFALIVLGLAAVSLVFLYLKGRTTEAYCGAGLLIVAAFLIFRGSKSQQKGDYHGNRR